MKYILLCGGMNTKEQKHFDKPRHLLEIKGGADSGKDDPELLRAVRQRQSELWNNAVYKKCFGGAL